MAFNSDKERYNLETKAYLEAENLRFKLSTAQQALDYFIEADEDSAFENWARATFKEEVKDAQEFYDTACVTLHVTELFDLYDQPLDEFEETLEEKIYRDKWRARSKYRRDISKLSGLLKAEEQHELNRRKAERQEKLSQDNPLTHLVKARNDYEELISIAEQEHGLDINDWEEVEVDTSTTEDTGKIIEETAEKSIEPEDRIPYDSFSETI